MQNFDQFSFSQANNVRLYLYNAYKKAMTTRHQILTQLELKEGQLEAVNSKLSELFDSLHKNEKKHDCQICNQKFKTKMKLNKHMRSAHKKRFNCNFCNKGFSSQWYVELHIEHVHKQSTKNDCKFCPQAFDSKDELRLHMKNAHKKDIKCKYCKKVIYTKLYMKDHIERVHKNAMKNDC